MKVFAEEIINGRCADEEYMKTSSSDCKDFKDHLIYVDLNQLPDDAQRTRLKQLPTSFVLKPEEVDELKEAAKSVLFNSKRFQDLLQDLNSSY